MNERELLKRLVELKDQKDRIDRAMRSDDFRERDYAGVEYHERYKPAKDAAWAEARALLAQPERKPQWQPIETAPKDGTGVMYFSPTGGCYVGNHPPGCAAGRWHWIFGRWRGQADDRAIKATHWMPLPKPPKE